MDFSEFYKQKEIDGIKSLVSRSRFMSEETKQFLMDILEKGKDQVMEAAKGKVKEDDEDEEDDDDDDQSKKTFCDLYKVQILAQLVFGTFKDLDRLLLKLKIANPKLNNLIQILAAPK
jgi:hypothetical protein